MTKALAFILFTTAVLLYPDPCAAAKIRFVFDAWQGPSMRVYATRPAGLAADRPVVFVMHGVNRNADDYRDQWHELALEHDFMLVVPEFSEKDFPGSRGYNLGYLEDRKGKARPRSRWAFSAIEPIFDEIRKRYDITTSRYAIYGHSAGAQFVHRFIFHVPGARVSQAVPANAGWYMMPDYQAGIPYGLGGSIVTPEMLAAAMAMPVTVLLGDKDIDPEDPNLRQTAEAMAQGAYRLARGQKFFEVAGSWAERAAVPFNWKLALVSGADHDNRLMAPAAVPYLLAEP